MRKAENTRTTIARAVGMARFAAWILLASPVLAQNLAVNPGFESGTTTPWFGFGGPTISVDYYADQLADYVSDIKTVSGVDVYAIYTALSPTLPALLLDTNVTADPFRFYSIGVGP